LKHAPVKEGVLMMVIIRSWKVAGKKPGMGNTGRGQNKPATGNQKARQRKTEVAGGK
jgi:hypothetical protein